MAFLDAFLLAITLPALNDSPFTLMQTTGLSVFAGLVCGDFVNRATAKES